MNNWQTFPPWPCPSTVSQAVKPQFHFADSLTQPLSLFASLVLSAIPSLLSLSSSLTLSPALSPSRVKH